jgi:hypothetical protein
VEAKARKLTMPIETVPSEKPAKKIFETFMARPSERLVPMPFSWPTTMQEVGQGHAIMYRSNKWKRNRKNFESYKHVAEDWQTLYVTPGFLRDWWRPAKKIEVYGPMVSFKEPMPQHFAMLAPLLGVQMRLFDEDLKLPKGDKRLFEVTVAHGMMGAAKHPKTEEPFVFVYSKQGIHMVFTGPSLDIEKDGIVG